MDLIVKLFSKGHAEPLEQGTEAKRLRWCLPHVVVFHSRKPENICVVFDGSATYRDVSLNKALLPGPDLVNSLLQVLVRFRQEPIAIMADVEQMLHCFYVCEDHQDLL